MNNFRPPLPMLGSWRCQRDEFYDCLSIGDFRIIRNKLFGDKTRTIKIVIPFHTPSSLIPVSSYQLTEEESRQTGISNSKYHDFLLRKYHVRTLQNMMVCLSSRQYRQNNRLYCFCAEASEVINTVALAMKTGQTYTYLRDFIFPHTQWMKD